MHQLLIGMHLYRVVKDTSGRYYLCVLSRVCNKRELQAKLCRRSVALLLHDRDLLLQWKLLSCSYREGLETVSSKLDIILVQTDDRVWSTSFTIYCTKLSSPLYRPKPVDRLKSRASHDSSTACATPTLPLAPV